MSEPQQLDKEKIVVRKGTLLNEKNKNLLTPLHIAADYSLYEIIDTLLKNGAKVNALDGLGQTALHRCARDDNIQACRLLLSYGIDCTIVSLQGYTAAQLASENVLKILKSPPDPVDLEVQLLESAKSGDLETVMKIVLSNPHTVNCRDLDGRHSTPLHFAAGECGAVISYAQGRNSTSLHLAAGYNKSSHPRISFYLYKM